MKTVTASCLVMALVAGVFGISSAAPAQVVTLSDTFNTTVTLATTSGQAATVTIPAGTTLSPALSSPLPFFLTPNTMDFGVFFLPPGIFKQVF